MLDLCAEYADEHNLVFSTDPNPELSKTKCLYMVGKVSGGQVQYPKPFRLSGIDLPWVTRANHLGHTLHEDCTMEENARAKHKVSLTHNVSFWAQKMTDNVSFWGQKLC